jgi:polyisoprenyl-phosphate glycosyltransferase
LLNTNKTDPTSIGRPQTKVALTIALPVFNEGLILCQLHAMLTRVCSEIGISYEILYVNDGSSDRTGEILEELAAEDPRVSIVQLSRNFGHPIALAAAIDLASGQSLILMDADLQDDPAAIPELIRAQREEQAEVVYVVRAGRKESLVMRFFFGLFHWLMAYTSTDPVPRNAGSFGLLGPRALVEVRRVTERLRYFPAIRSFVGFKQVGVLVERKARYDQKSRVGFWGLVRLAGLAFFAESRAPVTLFYIVSVVSLIGSIGLVAYAFIAKLIGIAVVSWASTVTSIAFFSSIIILGEAFVCEYLGRIYDEVRHRPRYIIEKINHARVMGEVHDDGSNTA